LFSALSFEAWSLEFLWMLALGAWCFVEKSVSIRVHPWLKFSAGESSYFVFENQRPMLPDLHFNKPGAS
jgi:hypothetical protein